MNKKRIKTYDRVMSRVNNRSRSNLQSSSVVTRHETPSSVSLRGKPSISNISSRVFSELPTYLNDYVPPSSPERAVKRSNVVKPKKTLKSLDPESVPVVSKGQRSSEKVRSSRGLGPVTSQVHCVGDKWSNSALTNNSNRSQTRLKELKDEIQEYNNIEKLSRLRGRLYHSCGVLLDEKGAVATEKGIQVTWERDESDGIRRKTWAEVIGRLDLARPDIKPRSYFVCGLHFEKSVIIHKPQLRPDALPTKLLPSLPTTSSASTESESKEISTQTKYSNINKLSVIHTIKGADTKSESAQTSLNSQAEQSQTSTALSSNTPRKRRINKELKASELKRRKLQNDSDKIKQEVKSEESQSFERFIFQTENEVTKRLD